MLYPTRGFADSSMHGLSFRLSVPKLAGSTRLALFFLTSVSRHTALPRARACTFVCFLFFFACRPNSTFVLSCTARSLLLVLRGSYVRVKIRNEPARATLVRSFRLFLVCTFIPPAQAVFFTIFFRSRQARWSLPSSRGDSVNLPLSTVCHCQTSLF
jgi:hypothetical protein